MKDRKTGDRVEARRGHVEIAADANDVRVRVVSKDDRVLVRVVAVVRRPNLRDERRLRRNIATEDTEEKKKCRWIDLQISVDCSFRCLFRVLGVLRG